MKTGQLIETEHGIVKVVSITLKNSKLGTPGMIKAQYLFGQYRGKTILLNAEGKML